MKRRFLMWFFSYVCRLQSKIENVLFPRSSGWSRSIFCMSSIDIKAKLAPHGAEWGPPGATLSELQAYAINHNLETGEASGELTFILFDTDPLDKALSQAGAAEEYDLLFRAVDEYGAIAEQRISQIRFTNWSHTISIDDIVSDVKVTFRASGMQRWKKLQVDQ